MRPMKQKVTPAVYIKKKKKERWSKVMYSLGILMEILREGEKGMMNKQ